MGAALGRGQGKPASDCRSSSRRLSIQPSQMLFESGSNVVEIPKPGCFNELLDLIDALRDRAAAGVEYKIIIGRVAPIGGVFPSYELGMLRVTLFDFVACSIPRNEER